MSGTRWPRFRYHEKMGSATTVKASTPVDYGTYVALRAAQGRDREELPDMPAMFAYCLKLGIEVYLDGQPEGLPAVDVRKLTAPKQ